MEEEVIEEILSILADIDACLCRIENNTKRMEKTMSHTLFKFYPQPTLTPIAYDPIKADPYYYEKLYKEDSNLWFDQDKEYG